MRPTLGHSYWIIGIALLVLCGCESDSKASSKLNVGTVDIIRVMEERPQTIDIRLDWASQAGSTYLELSQVEDQAEAHNLQQEIQKRSEQWQRRMDEFMEESIRLVEKEAVSLAHERNLDLVLVDNPLTETIRYHDGEDLIDHTARERFARLEQKVPKSLLVERVVADNPAAAEAFFHRVLAAGHEGVVAKSPTSTYEAGRRGASWIKVKPVHTLDLVVLAVEWGSGRRSGKLSNIHLGARDGSGGFVMLGKTFKGMTDEMLDWQTRRFLELQTGRDGHIVHVRPEQVVEIAVDGLQRSSRYPGGVALRFARVLRYRPDKSAAEANTLADVLDIIT